MASLRLARGAVAEFSPDRIPGALLDLSIPQSLALGGGPPRLEQIMGFLVEQLWIQVLPNQLHYGLPQFLITREIEDDVQASLFKDSLDTLLD